MPEKNKLDEKESEVIEQCGTEPPFSSELLDVEEDGVFRCKKCGQELFSSDHKYKSGTGWPSFWKPLEGDTVETRSNGDRTEVICSSCGGHLGHIFSDGPEDKTGNRYCINGIALEFEEDD